MGSHDGERYTVTIGQSVAVLIDGNNIEKSIHGILGDTHAMLNFDTLIPKLLDNRSLNRLIYFREGKNISSKLAERLHNHYHGSVVPCHKSADIPLTIKATQLSQKVDTIIILSGDSDYVELVRHLKSEGVRVEIAAIDKTTAKILIEEADYFHSITEEDWFVFNHPSSNKNNKRRPPPHRSSTSTSTSTSTSSSSTSTQTGSSQNQGSNNPSPNPNPNPNPNPTSNANPSNNRRERN